MLYAHCPPPTAHCPTVHCSGLLLSRYYRQLGAAERDLCLTGF
jgi:hypothetical protein